MTTQKRYATLLLALLWALPNLLPAQNFTHLELWMEPLPQSKTVKGKVAHRFVLSKPQDSIFLNGIRMDYYQVKLNGHAVTYRASDTGISLPANGLSINDTHHLELAYRCKPRKGLYFVGWNEQYPNPHPQIWTQGQGIDHRHWLPHNDDQRDKITFDLHITFNEEYTVIANGRKLQVQQVPHAPLKTWHYRSESPMSSYLIAVAIGRYAKRVTYSRSGIPLEQYYYPEQVRRYPTTYFANEAIFDFMEQKIGVPYPWPVYRQVPVQDFRHGAMENTAAVLFGDFFMVDSLAFPDQNYTYVNAHELAHHWHGNWVTATGSAHHWLHEGFATYYQWLSEGELYGEKYQIWERKKALDLVYQAMNQDTLALSASGAGAARYYQKGAWLLHMLHQELGDSLFDAAMQHYLKQYAWGLATTDSLRQSIQVVSGRDLSVFFKRWVHQPGSPVLSLGSRVSGDTLALQILPGSYLWDSLSIPLRLHFEDGSSQEQNLRYAGTATLQGWKIHLPKGPKLNYWTVNPTGKLLLLLREQRAARYHRRQWEGSAHLWDRWQALQGLTDSLSMTNRRLLVQIASDSTQYPPLRAQALLSLMQAEPDTYRSLLETILLSADLSLQKELVAGMDRKWDVSREVLLSLRLAPSYALREDLIHLLIEPQGDNSWLRDSTYRLQPGIPSHAVHLSSLAYRHLLYKEQEALRQILDYASPSYDFMTRMKALDILSQLRVQREEMVPLHFLALFDSNWKLRKTAKNGLATLYQDKGMRKALQAYRRRQEPYWEPWQVQRVNRTYNALEN